MPNSGQNPQTPQTMDLQKLLQNASLMLDNSIPTSVQQMIKSRINHPQAVLYVASALWVLVSASLLFGVLDRAVAVLVTTVPAVWITCSHLAKVSRSEGEATPSSTTILKYWTLHGTFTLLDTCQPCFSLWGWYNVIKVVVLGWCLVGSMKNTPSVYSTLESSPQTFHKYCLALSHNPLFIKACTAVGLDVKKLCPAHSAAAGEKTKKSE